MTILTQPNIIQITNEEYPPKWIGTKGNGMKKMVYRLDEKDCEMGLTWYQDKNYREIGYKWEHFDLIQKYK